MKDKRGAFKGISHKSLGTGEVYALASAIRQGPRGAKLHGDE